MRGDNNPFKLVRGMMIDETSFSVDSSSGLYLMAPVGRSVGVDGPCGLYWAAALAKACSHSRDTPQCSAGMELRDSN